LNCEDVLPALLGQFDFQFFPLASSQTQLMSSYDAALVEGCVSMPHERVLLQELRSRSKYLVAVGTCAVRGGIATLRNGENRELLRRQVYGQSEVGIETHDPMPLENVVLVDAAIAGCPPEKDELLSLLAGLTRDVLPAEVDYPVCAECRMRENLCLLTERNELCLGALTLGGCDARCPTLFVPCEGCRGPVTEPNLKEALEIYARQGFDRQTVVGRLRRFYPGWQP
jgi:coenzyme F420-reducing hydrogenase gamma subunit